MLPPHQPGRRGPGCEHRPDHHVSGEDLGLHDIKARIPGADSSGKKVVEHPEPGNRALHHSDLGPQAHSHPGGVGTDHAAAQYRYPGRGRARHAWKQEAHTAIVLLQMLGGRQDRQAPCDLGHWRQQGQAALSVGDSLVGDGRAA